MFISKLNKNSKIDILTSKETSLENKIKYCDVLVSDLDEDIRALVAIYGDKFHLKDLSKDSSIMVRCNVVKHCNDDLRDKLLKDSSHEVRALIAKHGNDNHREYYANCENEYIVLYNVLEYGNKKHWQKLAERDGVIGEMANKKLNPFLNMDMEKCIDEIINNNLCPTINNHYVIRKAINERNYKFISIVLKDNRLDINNIKKELFDLAFIDSKLFKILYENDRLKKDLQSYIKIIINNNDIVKIRNIVEEYDFNNKLIFYATRKKYTQIIKIIFESKRFIESISDERLGKIYKFSNQVVKNYIEDYKKKLNKKSLV